MNDEMFRLALIDITNDDLLNEIRKKKIDLVFCKKKMVNVLYVKENLKN